MQARNEVRVLASLNHPNIVKYYETFVEEKTGKLQIVMEYCKVLFRHQTEGAGLDGRHTDHKISLCSGTPIFDYHKVPNLYTRQINDFAPECCICRRGIWSFS